MDLRLLKEVRKRDVHDKEVREFDKWLSASDGDKNGHLCFSLHYGSEFVLSRLALQGMCTFITLCIWLLYLMATTLWSYRDTVARPSQCLYVGNIM